MSWEQPPTCCKTLLHFPNFLSFPTDCSIKYDSKGTLAHCAILINSMLLMKTDSSAAKAKCNSGKTPCACLLLAWMTCLAELPMDAWPILNTTRSMKNNNPNSTWKHNPVDAWDHWIQKLPYASLEPQELEILGSVKMGICIKFFYKPKWEVIERSTIIKERKIIRKDVSPYHPAYKNQSWRCNYTSPITSQSCFFSYHRVCFSSVGTEHGLPYHHVSRMGLVAWRGAYFAGTQHKSDS